MRTPWFLSLLLVALVVYAYIKVEPLVARIK